VVFRRHPYRRHRPKSLLAAGAIGCLFILRFFSHSWRDQDPLHTRTILREGLYQVQRIVDATTLLVTPVDSPPAHVPVAPVRLLGVRIPRDQSARSSSRGSACQALQLTESLVAGKTLRIRLDKRRTDRDGVQMAYIFDGDRLVNEELLRAGVARMATVPGDSQSIVRRLRAAEQEARDSRRGIWRE
jgi:micrococcal nuclease